MTKYERINQIISEFSIYFETLGDKDRYDCIELARKICQFKITQNADETISMDIFYGVPTSFLGNYETNEAVFIYALFSGLIELEFDFKETRRKLKLDIAKEFEKYIRVFSNVNASDEEVKRATSISCCNEFIEDLRRVVVDERKEKIKLLEKHKSNNIDEIRLINRIYDKFHVISSCILFFDSIDGINKQCGKSDSRKLQYTTFVIFKDVYIQTALWMNKESVMYWEMKSAWQLVEDFEMLIRKYFLKKR